ncbi:MAG: hypothetical protein RLY35_1965 [Bacteroidota bacterium]
MKLVALTDYKNRFGSKHFDIPYRSGMDKEKLKFHFKSFGLDLLFLPMSSAWSGFPQDVDYFIYTSIEDNGYLYKSYIEDVVLGLEQMGLKSVPNFPYLRANNNKGFMEFLRMSTKDAQLNTIRTQFYGTLEELTEHLDEFQFPVVIKKTAGASGRGVFKAKNVDELRKRALEVSSSSSFLLDLKDWVRSKRHSGYLRDSRNRNKFIVQNFIPDLENDWKIYWFHGEVYIFYRPVFAHRDFIASGGGYDNYSYGEDAYKPDGLFEYVDHIMSYFKVPHASLDIAFDGKAFHLLEIQFLYFGTAGIPYSKGYYIKDGGKWKYVEGKREIEEVYSKSVATFVLNES